MCLLRSYGFTKSADDVWVLFKNAEKLPKGSDWHALEIVNGVFGGSIQLQKYVDSDRKAEETGEEDTHSFNIGAYIGGIHRQERKEKLRYYKKHISIVDDDEEAGVSLDTLYVESFNPYDGVEDREELDWAIGELRRYRKDWLLDYHMDVVIALRQASRGVPESIKILKQVIEEDVIASKLIWIILNSGYRLEELFEECRED